MGKQQNTFLRAGDIYPPRCHPLFWLLLLIGTLLHFHHLLPPLPETPTPFTGLPIAPYDLKLVLQDDNPHCLHGFPSHQHSLEGLSCTLPDLLSACCPMPLPTLFLDSLLCPIQHRTERILSPHSQVFLRSCSQRCNGKSHQEFRVGLVEFAVPLQVLNMCMASPRLQTR